MQMGKGEVRLFLFARDLIICAANPKGDKGAPGRSVVSMLSEDKVNMQKSIALLHIAINAQIPQLKIQYHL